MQDAGGRRFHLVLQVVPRQVNVPPGGCIDEGGAVGEAVAGPGSAQEHLQLAKRIRSSSTAACLERGRGSPGAATEAQGCCLRPRAGRRAGCRCSASQCTPAPWGGWFSCLMLAAGRHSARSPSAHRTDRPAGQQLQVPRHGPVRQQQEAPGRWELAILTVAVQAVLLAALHRPCLEGGLQLARTAGPVKLTCQTRVCSGCQPVGVAASAGPAATGLRAAARTPGLGGSVCAGRASTAAARTAGPLRVLACGPGCGGYLYKRPFPAAASTDAALIPCPLHAGSPGSLRRGWQQTP